MCRASTGMIDATSDAALIPAICASAAVWAFTVSRSAAINAPAIAANAPAGEVAAGGFVLVASGPRYPRNASTYAMWFWWKYNNTFFSSSLIELPTAVLYASTIASSRANNALSTGASLSLRVGGVVVDGVEPAAAEAVLARKGTAATDAPAIKLVSSARRDAVVVSVISSG